MPADHVYYEVGSDTETVLADDEKNFGEDGRRIRRVPRSGRLIAKLRSSPWRIVEGISLLSILGLLLAIYRDLPRNQGIPSSSPDLQVGGDVTKFAPKCTSFREPER